jgi:hypothetical protein
LASAPNTALLVLVASNASRVSPGSSFKRARPSGVYDGPLRVSSSRAGSPLRWERVASLPFPVARLMPTIEPAASILKTAPSALRAATSVGLSGFRAGSLAASPSVVFVTGSVVTGGVVAGETTFDSLGAAGGLDWSWQPAEIRAASAATPSVRETGTSQRPPALRKNRRMNLSLPVGKARSFKLALVLACRKRRKWPRSCVEEPRFAHFASSSRVPE